MFSFVSKVVSHTFRVDLDVSGATLRTTIGIRIVISVKRGVRSVVVVGIRTFGSFISALGSFLLVI